MRRFHSTVYNVGMHFLAKVETMPLECYILHRMKKFIDWSRVDYVLALDPPSDLNLESEIKTIFLRRLKSVINTKINPRLVWSFLYNFISS